MPMKQLINDDLQSVYVLTSELEGNHYGMVATWICPASLRSDELRFTIPISKFNDSLKPIIHHKKFMLHLLGVSDFKLAFKMGAGHSSSLNKFEDINYTEHPSGLRILDTAISYGLTEVISWLETEDRFILYCKIREVIERRLDTSPLYQQDFFKQLNDAERKILKTKFMEDSRRDTP